MATHDEVRAWIARLIAEHTTCPLTHCPACARTVDTLVTTSRLNPERLGAK
jgi:hypothetical protein